MSKPIMTMDIETDPFLYGRLPRPFYMNCFDGKNHYGFWGSDCVQKMREFLEAIHPHIIYLHNGGKFDTRFFMDWLIGNPMRIINSRIIKAQMPSKSYRGFHEFRDSYSIIPVALGSVEDPAGKIEIDYAKFEADVRDQYRDEIITYAQRDVAFLHKLVMGFIDRFDTELTIGSTSMKQLLRIHPITRLSIEEDSGNLVYKDGQTDGFTRSGGIRKPYYFGGRVQCFEFGDLKSKVGFKVYDVNSMYPHSMKSFRHPISQPIPNGVKIIPETAFVTVEGIAKGCFPQRTKDGLMFPHGRGIFNVSIHEYKTALELKLFEPIKILTSLAFDEWTTFSDFVDKYYSLRVDSALAGDEIGKLFWKLILNSAYGKFAQNPENYDEFQITAIDVDLHAGCDKSNHYLCWRRVEFTLAESTGASWMVWSRPSVDSKMYNVATGASITGASRAILMRGIAKSKRPVYCDTDSLICEHLPGALNTKALGDWKLEATGSRLALAGKKLYVLFDDKMNVVKKATKGVDGLEPKDLLKVCQGKTVKCRRDAPTLKLNGGHLFLERTVKMTASNFVDEY